MEKQAFAGEESGKRSSLYCLGAGKAIKRGKEDAS